MKEIKEYLPASKKRTQPFLDENYCSVRCVRCNMNMFISHAYTNGTVRVRCSCGYNYVIPEASAFENKSMV